MYLYYFSNEMINISKLNNNSNFSCLKKWDCRASLVAQWLRICLPMPGTRVRALVREDPTCRGAAKAPAPQLLSLRSRAREPELL